MLSSMHTPMVFKHCLLNQKHTVILSSRNSVRFKVTDSWQYRVDRRSLQCTFVTLATDRHSESKTPRVFHRPWKYPPLSLSLSLLLWLFHHLTPSLTLSPPPPLSLCYFSSSLVIISHHHPAVIIYGCAVAITVCFLACTVCIHQVCCSS